MTMTKSTYLTKFTDKSYLFLILILCIQTITSSFANSLWPYQRRPHIIRYGPKASYRNPSTTYNRSQSNQQQRRIFVPTDNDGNIIQEKNEYEVANDEMDEIFEQYKNNDNNNNKNDIQEKIREKVEQMKLMLQQSIDNGYRPYSVQNRNRKPGSYSLTSKLVFVNVGMYILQMISPKVTQFGAKRSELILQGKELHRLFTPMFLHGSFMHLMLNTFSLQNIGPEVEKLFGGGRFLSAYVAGGVMGNVMSAMNTPNPSLGASGAVFGLMGAYYTFLSRNEQFFGESGQLMMGRVGTTLTMNILFGLASPNIDNWAHIGGGIGGAIFATTFGPKLYLLTLPMGGRMIVDKPMMRLPPYLENIPSEIGKKLRMGRRRLQMDRFQSDLTAKPWRRKRSKRLFERSRKPLKPLFGE
jgi:membrane associated rhomboid family serine protease